MRNLWEQRNCAHKLQSPRLSKRKMSELFWTENTLLAFEAGKPADSHALTPDEADPAFVGAQESSRGAFGPTPVDQEPQTS